MDALAVVWAPDGAPEVDVAVDSLSRFRDLEDGPACSRDLQPYHQSGFYVQLSIEEHIIQVVKCLLFCLLK